MLEEQVQSWTASSRQSPALTEPGLGLGHVTFHRLRGNGARGRSCRCSLPGLWECKPQRSVRRAVSSCGQAVGTPPGSRGGRGPQARQCI